MFRLPSHSLSWVNRSSLDKVKTTNKQTNNILLKIRRVNHNYAVKGFDNENLSFQRYSETFPRQV